jgi:hypothetical protein
MSFICSSQVRGVRYFNSFILSVVLVICQGLTLLVFRSDLCNEYGCTFSRGAGFSVAAVACFFLAGICFLFTKDYPGDRVVESPAATGAVAVASKDMPGAYDEEVVVKYDDNDDDEVEEEVIENDDDEDDMEEEVVEDEDEEMGQTQPDSNPPAINAMASAEA